MAIQFLPGQVAVSDPSPIGPSALSGPSKDVSAKVVRLTSANFSTGGTNTLVAVLPADSSITSFRLWTKTQLAGGSISAATYSVGTASAGTQFINAATAFATAGTYTVASPVNNIVQNYQVPQGPDIQIWVNGTATTGNPTSGELYLIIEYVR